MYCGKTADWIWMPFGLVSRISQWMGVLDGVEIVEGEGFGGKCGASHCNQWGLCGVVILCREGWRRALPKLLWDFLCWPTVLSVEPMVQCVVCRLSVVCL